MNQNLTFVVTYENQNQYDEISLSINRMLSNVVLELLEISPSILLKEIELLTVNNRLGTLLQLPEDAFESYCSSGHYLRGKLEDLYHITKYALDNKLEIVIIFD